MSWSDLNATGVSLPENSLLFEVCFTPNSSYAHPNLSFVDGRLVDNQGGSPFLGKNGYALFDLYFPLGPAICEYAALRPSCLSDGYGRILLGGCDADDPVNGNYTHNGIFYDNLSGLLFADSGSYKINASQYAQSSNSFFAYIPAGIDSLPCVWPGDADDNNAVNHHDLLYLGLGYGTAGVPRANASLEWLGQESADWQLATSVRNINFKNIDANGDGVIDAADTLAIVQNWGRVINPARHDPFNAPLGNPTGNSQPPFTIQADTLSPGQMVALPLLLGSQDMPADSIYGLAFSISYDREKVKSDVSFRPSDSWLGQKAEMLWLQKNFPEQGRLDVAITRTDGMPVSGWGPIGDVFVIIEDDIFFGSFDPEADGLIDTVAKTTLFFSSLSTVNSNEDPLELNAPPVELVILKSTTSTTAPDWNALLQMYPNPASDMLYVSLSGQPILEIEITDVAGRTLARFAGNNNYLLDVPVNALPAGPCFIRVFSKDGVAVKKVNIF
ncbi:MAG: T9SS type A sorting domain-containing protein [Lewinellaceae bacterium]|nr:T9SS type A sorting domain-containing protein [Lewinellaceae bacterium]